MKFKMVIAALCIASGNVSAEKVEVDMECEISFMGKVYASGPCKVVVRDNVYTSIKGKNSENGVSFNLVGDENKGTALLMGAGTFPLADGKVQTNVGGMTYSWPNGYALDTQMP